ncbi:MAG: spermidine synthase [Thiohalophilus sp.]
MAILWQKTYQGSTYEVRAAGRTRRLYTDGVFHSQYHPGRTLAGGIWDLLWLGALFRQPPRLRRVLMLGVGGGTVFHQLQRYADVTEMVGVELNPIHVQVARDYFEIAQCGAQLHQAEAGQWLRDYRGPTFDLIIEDLFGEQSGEPVRAISADQQWFELLNRNLSRDGILVMNFVSRKSLRDCAWYRQAKLRKALPQGYQFTLPAYENYIACFLRQPSSSQCLREQLNGIPALAQEISRGNFNFTVRRLLAGR